MTISGIPERHPFTSRTSVLAASLGEKKSFSPARGNSNLLSLGSGPKCYEYRTSSKSKPAGIFERGRGHGAGTGIPARALALPERNRGRDAFLEWLMPRGLDQKFSRQQIGSHAEVLGRKTVEGNSDISTLQFGETRKILPAVPGEDETGVSTDRGVVKMKG